MKKYINFNAIPTLVALAMAFTLPVLALPIAALGQTYASVDSSVSTDSMPVYQSGCVNLTYNLYFGARDSFTAGQVSQLQVFLKTSGYYNGPVTGFFGGMTFASVVQYQRAHGVFSSGYVGTLTRASIKSVSCGNQTGTPIVSSLSPSYGAVGTLVTVTGSGFTSDNTVYFNGEVASHVASSNGSTLTFTVPSYLAPYCPAGSMCPAYVLNINPGNYNISVHNANGTSNSLVFTVTSGSTINTPTVSSLSPASGAIGTMVTITGSGFTSDNTVMFDYGAILHVSSSNGTSLSFMVPDSLNAACFYSSPRCLMPTRMVAPGNYNVSVQNSNGTSNSLVFTVTGGNTVNTPTVSSINPTSGSIGTMVTVTGSHFTSDNTIYFGTGAVAHISSSNGTTLTFTVPEALDPECYFSNPPCMTFAASQRVTPGNYNVSVKNSNGTSNSLTFTVTGGTTTGTPHVSSLSPSYGPVGTTFTIYGSGFTSDNNVKFDIGAATHVIAGNNGSTLTFTVPSYTGYSCAYANPNCPVAMIAKQITPGNYNVSVENANGLSNTMVFTVTGGNPPPSNQPPVITGASGPTQLSVNQTGTWSISAHDYSNGSLSYAVTWGDEGYYANSMSSAAYSSSQQTSTFNHAYSQPGTYTIRFTVTNNAGVSTFSTMTVNVSAGYYYGY